jgi:hydrogenase maturation protease
MRPAEALALAETLGMLPPRVVVFGIEAASVEPALGLSHAVAAAIPGVVDRILEELVNARDVAASWADQAN